MKLKKFNIFGWSVPVLCMVIDENLHGFFDSAKKEIVMHKNADEKFHTMMHEFGHAVWFRTGMNQTGIPISMQEIIVENFASAFVENFNEICYNKKTLEKK